MRIKYPRFTSFKAKLTLALVLSLLIVAGLRDILLYETNINLQFKYLRDKLLVIAKTSSIIVDGDMLLKIPLNKDGVNSQEYKIIVEQLKRIKQVNPSVKYIYTMVKTDKLGTWQFVVDPDPVMDKAKPDGPTAYPGDKYDVSRFPEMQQAFSGPAVDKNLSKDEWGAIVSGYAPIYDKNGKAVAILGVDIRADIVYTMQKAVLMRAIFVLFVGIVASIILGFAISKKVTGPIEKLVQGTRKIAQGDLDFKVEVKSKDEIGELASSFNEMAKSLAESRKNLNDYFYRMVQSMVRSLEAKDTYTRGHSDRVSEYAEKIAIVMGFEPEKVESLRKAAQLHDIGKLGIHEDILNKKTALSDDEWDVVHKHPAVGEEILKPIFLDEEMLAVARSHHERYDGKGYPDGLKGEETNIFAQIVAVADSYDAMTSSRAYRPALNKEEAVRRLKEGSGAQFNPKIVDVFTKILK